MSDTGPMMRATFHGGPADGGELALAEPIRDRIHFPIGATAAVTMLARDQAAPWLATTPPADYRLALTPDNRVIRDTRGRVIYDHVRVTAPNPTEGDTP